MKPERADKRHAVNLDWTRREIPQWLRATVLLLVIGAAVTGGMFAHQHLLDLARDATGATPAGMAIAGWLMVIAPFTTMFLFWQLGEPDRLSRSERRARLATRSARVRGAARVALLTLTVPLAVAAFSFFPGRGTHLADLVTGPGAPAFRIGLATGWATAFGGVIALSLAGVAEELGSLKADRRRLGRIVLPLWALATLTAAVIIAV